MTEVKNENNTETVETAEDKNSQKLVPLSESVKYRKRAQNAEKAAETLKDNLNQNEQHRLELEEKLNKTKTENQIMQKLSKAGIRDIEAGLALTKLRLSENNNTEIDEVIQQICNEKDYLFNSRKMIMPTKTASIKANVPEAETVLAESAKKAAASGSRVDLQQYLKVRRNFI